MKHIDIVKLYNDPAYIGQQVTVCGWVRTSRDSKNVAFVDHSFNKFRFGFRIGKGDEEHRGNVFFLEHVETF